METDKTRLDEGIIVRLRNIEDRAEEMLKFSVETVAGYLKASGYAEAAEAIDPNLALPKDSGELHIIKGELYNLGGVREKAAEHYDKAVEICPSDGILSAAADFYHETIDWGREISCRFRCLQLNLPDATRLEVLHKLGNTVWLSDEFQNVAERLFRAMSPDRIEYGPYYINYNELENYYLKYIKIYEEQAANDVDRYAPHLAAILNNMGDLRMYVDNFTEAEDYFNRAGRIYERLSSNAPATWNPRLAASLLKLAEACIFLKKAEASTHIAEALRKCPDLPRCNPLLYIKSFCSLTMPYRYGSKPDYAKAEALCLECLNTFKSLMEEDGKRWGPYAASVLWQLAKIYRVHFGDKERAREAGEEALRMIEGCGDGLLARKVEDRVFRELRRR